MFIIQNLMIEDKKLADVLHALSGKVVSMEPPRPVTNAKVENGEVVPITASGSVVEMWVKHVHDHNIASFNLSLLSEFVSDNGRAPSTAKYVVKELVNRGLAKRVGRGEYEITTKGAK